MKKTIVLFPLFALIIYSCQSLVKEVNQEVKLVKVERPSSNESPRTKLRSKSLPTIPSSLEDELKSNIFLRCDQNDLKIKFNMKNKAVNNFKNWCMVDLFGGREKENLNRSLHCAGIMTGAKSQIHSFKVMANILQTDCKTCLRSSSRFRLIFNPPII